VSVTVGVAVSVGVLLGV
jgi:hypothetical protein